MDKLTKQWIKEDLKNDCIINHFKEIINIEIAQDKKSCIVSISTQEYKIKGVLKTQQSPYNNLGDEEYYIYWEGAK